MTIYNSFFSNSKCCIDIDIETNSKPLFKPKPVEKMRAKRNPHTTIKNTTQNPEIEIVEAARLEAEAEAEVKKIVEAEDEEKAKLEAEEKPWLPPPAKTPLLEIEMIKVDNDNLEALIKKAQEDHRSVIYCHVSTPAQLELFLDATLHSGRTLMGSIPSTLSFLIKASINGLSATTTNYFLICIAQ